MRVPHRRFPSFAAAAVCLLGIGLLPLLFTACDRTPTVAVKPPLPTPPTPDPHEEALVERTVRDRLAEENRVTEQQLANARAAASQRMVGRQMFLKLEEQYRQRQAELSGDEKTGQGEPSASPEPDGSQLSAAPRSLRR